MDFSKLFSTAKDLSENEMVKNIASKAMNNKKVKKTVESAKKKIVKAAKSAGIDVNSILKLVTKNKDVVSALVKLGVKKDEDPAAATVQRLVSSLKSTISKASGTKVDDDTFSSIVTKLVGVDKVKTNLEEVAGRGVVGFIKKAVKEYIE